MATEAFKTLIEELKRLGFQAYESKVTNKTLTGGLTVENTLLARRELKNAMIIVRIVKVKDRNKVKILVQGREEDIQEAYELLVEKPPWTVEAESDRLVMTLAARGNTWVKTLLETLREVLGIMG